MSEFRIRVAIIGGGIGGICVANALFKKPNLNVHVYEAAPEFSERGAAIVLATNVIDALEAIVPSAREVVLASVGTVPMNGSCMMMVRPRPQSYSGASVFVQRATVTLTIMNGRLPLPL